MITQHFLKVLTIFVGMIIVGLICVFVSSYLEKGDAVSVEKSNQVEVVEQ